jgi:peptide/nickel transport system substrate-binding protein
MPGTPWRARLAALGATTAIIVGACGGAATPTPAPPATAAPTAAPVTPAPPTAAPFVGLSYPTASAVDCAAKKYNGKDYSGNFKTISATDAKTVVFELCNPDVAFLAKIAFSSFAIQDADWLAKAVADKTILLRQPNGTGPYQVKEWKAGDSVIYSAFANYWGTAALAPNAVLKWSTEAAQRLVELQSGNTDGIDNPGTDDMAAIAADSSLTLYPRAGLNVMYVGMNNTYAPFDNEKVRQAIAMGIDRERIVKNFYPAGSNVATKFTPCAIEFACGGEDWYAFDVKAAQALLAEAGFKDGFKTTISYRDVSRGYMNDANVVAQDLQQQLKNNLNIEATIDVQESGTFLANSDAGNLKGLYLLGWGADYPDPTNFLDYHFGAGASKQFGTKWDDVIAALAKGASSADPAVRTQAYADANNAIRTHVPMIPVASGASATAFKADVTGAHSSPLGNEGFSVMKPAGRDTLVFTQNAEPISLYCADESDGESLRACEQATQSLYGYKTAGAEVEPVLATKCEASTDGTVWTCTLRDGVTFHDGATLDANDVVTTFSAQWDAENPLHVGNTGAFSYFSGFFGGFLNPPPPTP